MKKGNLIVFAAIVLSFIGLVLLKVTGMTGHIVISIAALAVMVVFTILGRKNWKLPVLEIGYRLAYLIALITGIVMIQARVFGAVSIVHKVSAGLFAVLYVVNFFLTAKKQ